jgi:hypothetical protein
VKSTDQLRAIVAREIDRFDGWSKGTGLSDDQLKALEALARIARHIGDAPEEEVAPLANVSTEDLIKGL